jgi:phage regulator Rha-like protein
MRTTAIVPVDRMDRIESRILLIRGQRVMLDADLAEAYGTTTKALNQAVKRNRARFPGDFMFRLTKQEKAQVVTTCDHLHRLKFSPSLPFAFTEHGAIMLASVLNSTVAVQASIAVVRAFTRLREVLATHQELAGKLAELEQRIEGQSDEITALFEAIRQLMEPPEGSSKRIGFHARPAPANPKE